MEFTPDPLPDSTATFRLTRTGGPPVQAYLFRLTVVGTSPDGANSRSIVVWFDY